MRVIPSLMITEMTSLDKRDHPYAVSSAFSISDSDKAPVPQNVNVPLVLSNRQLQLPSEPSVCTASDESKYVSIPSTGAPETYSSLICGSADGVIETADSAAALFVGAPGSFEASQPDMSNIKSVSPRFRASLRKIRFFILMTSLNLTGGAASVHAG